MHPISGGFAGGQFRDHGAIQAHHLAKRFGPLTLTYEEATVKELRALPSSNLPTPPSFHRSLYKALRAPNYSRSV